MPFPAQRHDDPNPIYPWPRPAVLNSDHPMFLFEIWLSEAALNAQIEDENTVNLATVSKSGQPSDRMVTMRAFDEAGFIFLTHSHNH